jgi:hypothetical protein
VVEQREEHGRYAREHGDLVALHDLEHLLGIETRDQGQRPTDVKGSVHD